MTARGWIGVDLDGTLAHYDGWKGIEHIGAPIAPMVARVKGWLEEGVDVRIFTARVAIEDPAERDMVLSRIDAWCHEYIGRSLPITNVKDFGMVELWDDRAIEVIANTGLTLPAAHLRETILARTLELATTRLEIMLGRARGCDSERPADEPARHGVTEIEAPGWIEDQRAVLDGCPGAPPPNAPQPFACKARASSTDPPQDCDWPTCGCDPHAERVIQALHDIGYQGI